MPIADPLRAAAEIDREEEERGEFLDVHARRRLRGPIFGSLTRLRKTYHDLLDEPLPEHLVVFVRELESQGAFRERWSGLWLFSRSNFESGSGGM